MAPTKKSKAVRRRPASVSESEAKAARLSPRLVQSLRKRLGLSQMALARLVGVSAPAVAHWEAGNSSPKGQNRAALVGLRKVGKREVRELLARRVRETASRVSPAVPPRFVLVDSGRGVPRRRDGLMVGDDRLTRAQCGTGQGGDRLREFTAGG